MANNEILRTDNQNLITLAASSSYAVSASFVSAAYSAGTSVSSSYSSTASVATSITFIPISASYAPTNPTGSFTGSFTGSVTNAVSASFVSASYTSQTSISSSYANTASAATSITFVPITSSYAVTASSVSAIAGSNVGAASYSGSFTGSILVTGSVTGSHIGSFTGSYTGSFTGSALFSTGTVFATVPEDATISAPNTNAIYSSNAYGRPTLNQSAPTGRPYPFQPAFYQNNITIIDTAGGAALTSIGTLASISGTVTHPDVPVEFIGYMANIATAATSGNVGIVQTFSRQFLPQGTKIQSANGFFFSTRTLFPDASASYGNTTKIFIGFGSTQQLNSFSSGTLNTGSWCGFYYSSVPSDAKPGKFRFGVGTGTTSSFTDTGIFFDTSSIYEFNMYMPASSSFYSGSLGWGMNVFAPGSASLTTVQGGNTLYPSPSQSLCAGITIVTLANTALNMRFNNIYIETDR